MTTSPFVQMASALTLHRHQAWQNDTTDTGGKPISRTERIRQLLRQEGRGMTSGEIAFDLGEHFPNFGAHLVWLLLKHDISKGRVRLADGLYYYNAEFDTDQATAIRAAEALLKRHGYVFTKTGKRT